jgi:SNF2 family DNA or RNA helicase
VERDVPLLLVNPNAVKTGLNCLVSFSTAIWYELDLSALTYRQANGRLHRIGQTRPVTIHVPFYRKTVQEIAFELLAKKVSASLKVDGLDLAAALEAAGAGAAQTAAVASVMGLGQAIYEKLIRQN